AILAQNVDVVGLHSALYQMAFIEGDGQTMQREVSWKTGTTNEHIMIFNQAQASASAGKITQARKLFKLAVDTAQREGLNETAASYLSREALSESLFGNTQQARVRAKEALGLDRQPHPPTDQHDTLGGSTAALAFAGELRDANALIDEMKKNFSQNTFLHFV